MADLHILTNERIILQLYEITQMFVDFLQRYDNMSKDIRSYYPILCVCVLFTFLAQSLTAEQLFRNSTLNQILTSELTAEKKYEPAIFTSKINYLFVC